MDLLKHIKLSFQNFLQFNRFISRSVEVKSKPNGKSHHPPTTTIKRGGRLNHQLHGQQRRNEREREKKGKRARERERGELSTSTITFTVIFIATLELGARIKMGTRSSECVSGCVHVCVRLCAIKRAIFCYTKFDLSGEKATQLCCRILQTNKWLKLRGVPLQHNKPLHNCSQNNQHFCSIHRQVLEMCACKLQANKIWPQQLLHLQRSMGSIFF